MTPEELGQRVKSKYPQYQSIPDGELGTKIAAKHPQYQVDTQSQEKTQQPFVGGLVGQGLDVAFNKAPASIRERVRTLGKTGDINQANQAADEAYKNPSSSEDFQNEDLQKYYGNDINPSPLKQIGGLVKSAIGIGKDFVTSPGQMGLAVATEGASKALAPVNYKGLTLGERFSKLPVSKVLASKEELLPKIENLGVEARDTAVKLFPQADGDLEDIRNTGTAVSKYVSKSKNSEELANQLEMAKGINAGERAKLYESGTLSEARTQHEPILALLEEARTSPSVGTPEGRLRIKNLEDIQTSDADFLSKQSKEDLNNPNFYQKMKEHYQKLAKRAGSYKTDPNQSVKADAYRAMSEGYQNKTYAVDDAIRPINQEEAGLIKGHQMARENAAGEALGLKPSVGERALKSIGGSPQGSAARFVGRTLWDRIKGSPVKGLTKKIEKLTNKSESAQKVVDLIDKVLSQRPQGKGSSQLMLEGNKTLGLPAPKESIPMEYTGSPSGSTIELPSDYYMIKNDLRMGEPRDVRGVSKLPSEGKYKLKELMSRRKENFK